ncbi:MAG: helix-turn-helix transcriptional regulator [Clostridia bacterium]|nr:helix-turn-helix transcriptional regulator [Clostridia bacterium]MBP3495708.1 helix-turn-helix transcriptional regulator [Clostridia bacterium]MBQ7789366.1 helix-turn-helix transcriptional regulator [Clostridia bacterium]
MKTRKHVYGDSNLIGKNVEQIRKAKQIKQKDFIAQLQVAGLNINPTSYSKLEGQIRVATDKEILVIARVLQVDINELFKNATL